MQDINRCHHDVNLGDHCYACEKLHGTLDEAANLKAENARLKRENDVARFVTDERDRLRAERDEAQRKARMEFGDLLAENARLDQLRADLQSEVQQLKYDRDRLRDALEVAKRGVNLENVRLREALERIANPDRYASQIYSEGCDCGEVARNALK